MLSWLALGSLLWCSSSEAALNLMRTRVIYEGVTEASLMVRNDGSEPSLLQAWVDGGNEQQGPADVSTPFLVVPPMMRLGSQRGQVLRILGADLSGLPQDRESLFWLNVLGLPPKAQASQGSVQLAYRTRIKLFYRPSGLAGWLAGLAGRGWRGADLGSAILALPSLLVAALLLLGSLWAGEARAVNGQCTSPFVATGPITTSTLYQPGETSGPTAYGYL